MADNHRKSHVQDGSGVGVGTTFDALVRAHGKPKSFEFPERALITLYHSVVVLSPFNSIEDSTMSSSRRITTSNGESHSHRGDGAVKR